MENLFNSIIVCNILRDPTDHILVYNIRAANSRYTKRLHNIKDQSNKKIIKYRPSTNQPSSAKQKTEKVDRKI